MKYAARTVRGSTIVNIVEIKTGKVICTRGTWAAACRAAAQMNQAS